MRKLRIVFWGVGVLFASYAWGCESDPILAPQQEEEDKGSYALAKFNDTDSGISPTEGVRKRNPELF